jgi:hypothetical protein
MQYFPHHLGDAMRDSPNGFVYTEPGDQTVIEFP